MALCPCGCPYISIWLKCPRGRPKILVWLKFPLSLKFPQEISPDSFFSFKISKATELHYQIL